MSMPHDDRVLRDDRVLVMLQRLLGIRSPELRPALDEAIDADQPRRSGPTRSMSSSTRPTTTRLSPWAPARPPLGRRQRALGLDRLPLSNGGRAAWVFRTGEPYMTGHADQDPEELRGIVEGLGVRSM